MAGIVHAGAACLGCRVAVAAASVNRSSEARSGGGLRVRRADADESGVVFPLRVRAVRAVKVAIADALRADPTISALVDPSSIYAVERSVLPTLPSIETIGVSSERQDTGPMVRHELSIEITVSHTTEDGADTLLDSIVGATRSRLAVAVYESNPIPPWRMVKWPLSSWAGRAGQRLHRARRASSVARRSLS